MLDMRVTSDTPMVNGDGRLGLSSPRTPLFGREEELLTARALLRRGDVGLITLAGPGGSGKTRLALALAESIRRGASEGVIFIPLAGVADPALVLPSIGRAIGLLDASDRPLVERLIGALAAAPPLLVLDNFEQVVAAAADLAALVAGCPALKVVVTSRMPLRLRDEQILPVLPLALPVAGAGQPRDALLRSPAVAMFVACVRRMQPAYEPHDGEVEAIAEICRWLDGLPLALELAAARCAMLSPRALLDRLDRRLDLLDAGPRDLPARQRTLRQAIAWSHDLLDESERRLFRRLAVFAGDVAPSAIEAAFDASDERGRMTLDLLASLVEKNLLQRADTPEGEVRLRMLETIREFAREHLAESDDLAWAQRRHAAFVLTVVETIGEATADGGCSWLDRVDRLRAEVRAALRRALDRDERGIAARLVWRLAPYWFYTGQLNEGLRWAEELLASAETAGDRASRVRALCIAGVLDRTLGQLDRARARLEACADLALAAGDAPARAACLAVMSQWRMRTGDTAAARSMTKEAVALLRGTGEIWLLGLALAYHGQALGMHGDLDAGRDHCAEALPLLRACGIPAALSLALMNLAMLAERGGDAGGAETLYRESCRISGLSGDNSNTVGALIGLGRLALRRKAAEEAATLLAESIRLTQRLGSAWLLADALDVMAAAAYRLARPRDAAVLAGAIERLRSASGVSRAWARLYPGLSGATLAALRDALGDAACEAALSAGRALSPEAAAAYALTIADRAGAGGEGTARSAGAPDPPGGLTEREVEVLRLLAAGLTNREIAATLVLSPRTVGHHVEHIYRKTGTHGRAEATGYALRHGLATG